MTVQGLKKNLTTLKRISDDIADRIEAGEGWNGEDIKAMGFITDRLVGALKVSVELGLDPETSNSNEDNEAEVQEEIRRCVWLGVDLALSSVRNRDWQIDQMVEYYRTYGTLKGYVLFEDNEARHNDALTTEEPT
jgi:hypothetical protein